ncbi:MAG TPA: AI-2E family transporter [Stellaceae bacterium]|nr:AI-2E family transporter [Stellaceae bacterium]
MTSAWVRALFWAGFAAAFAVLLSLLSSILLPFVLGAVIAFLFNPLVDRLERAKLPRTLGTLVALAGFLFCIVLFFLLLVPLLEVQLAQLVKRFPAYLAGVRAQLDDGFQLLQDRLAPDDLDRLRSAAEAKLAELVGGLGSVATSVLTGGVAVANMLSLIFVTPIVAFFLLRDWHAILKSIDAWLPRRHIDVIRAQVREINETLSGFARGQASVCLLMGSFYAVGLTLIGVESGAVVGFCIGVLIFIPFVGGLSGAVMATLLAAAQYGLWEKPLWVVVLFVVGQSLEANVVTPKLIGDRVHLHSLWVIFSLFAFGALFGFLGVLIAVPMAAVLGVLVRFALHQYLASPLYAPIEPDPEP